MAQLLAQAGAQDRGLPASTALPARARPPPPPSPHCNPTPPPALTPPLPASSRRLLAPLPHQSPQDADLTSPLKTLTSASLAASTGSQVTARDKDGWEPLHYACFHNHLGTAEWLLQAGADVSAASKDGWTPLHAAVPGASLDARSRCDSPFLRQPHDSHHTTVAPQVDAGHVQLSRFLGARGAGGARHRTRARRSRYRVFRDFSAAQPPPTCRSPGAHERRQRASPCGSGQRAPRARAVARSNDEGRKRVLAR